jgi:rubrerythrin
MDAQPDFFTAATQVVGIERLDVPAMELLFKLECSGEDFYNALADRIGNAEAAELLRRNGREERGHARRLQRAIEIKLDGDYSPSPEMLERYAVPLPDTIDAEILPVIVRAEVDGDASYQRWADHETDPEVAKLLRQNGSEESTHGERVRQAIAILEAAGA